MLTSAVLRQGLLLLLTMQNTVTVLCLRYSRTHPTSSETVKNGTDIKGESSVYFVSTLVLTLECIKLVIVLLFLLVQNQFSLRQTCQLLYDQVFCRPFDSLQLAVPSFLYIIQDNLIIYALSCLDAATYQVTYQVRILTTAFFAKTILKQDLFLKHWMALFMLMIGVILTQVNFDQSKGNFSFRSDKEGSLYFLGLLCVGCATLTSGFAGIYNEKVMKNQQQQPLLFIRCFQMSFFSIIFASLGVVIKDGQTVREKGLYYGFSPFIWFIALMQAGGGIIVAATIKYADNILKTFATSISIVLSCFLSYLILGDLSLTPTFVVGTIVIVLATLLYSRASQSFSQQNPNKS